MAWKATFRAIEAAERRKQCELDRQVKKQAQDKARSEVETYESRLFAVLSLHRNAGETWDWKAISVSLPPHPPQKTSYHELKAKQRILVLPPNQTKGLEANVEEARLQDEQEFERAMHAYSSEITEYEKLKKLSLRILAGDHKAFTEVLAEFNPFAELSELGSSIHFTVHHARLIECVLKVSGKEAIPAEVKTLTSTGKVSVKPTPKGRFHEHYQDYVCSCILRVARELFALLPLDMVLVTATINSVDSRTGLGIDQSVLSVVIPRSGIKHLDFDRLDPSDAIETFQHRGDFKASRKGEVFHAITPLTASDISQTPVEAMDLDELLARIQSMREEVNSRISQLSRMASVMPAISPL